MSLQLDSTVIIPCVNGTCKLKQGKLFVMDNTSLRQIIERIPELKHSYSGSFLAKCIQSLPTFRFAVINTSPSSEMGEHWIMIERLNRTYYYVYSLARPITPCKFGSVLTGVEKFKSVAANVGWKTLRKQLGGENIRKRRIIWKSSSKPVELEEILFLI